MNSQAGKHFKTRLLRPRSNDKHHIRRTKSQFESIQTGKARPLDQTSKAAGKHVLVIDKTNKVLVISQLGLALIFDLFDSLEVSNF